MMSRPKCRICKNELTVPMGYNWGACDRCAKKAIDTASKKATVLHGTAYQLKK